MEVLRGRLEKRGDTSVEAIEKRLKIAGEELKSREIEGFWDIVIVNDDLEKAYSTFKSYVMKSEEE